MRAVVDSVDQAMVIGIALSIVGSAGGIGF